MISEDEKINFYRKGTASIPVNGKTFTDAGKSTKWNVTLRGPRSGFSNFNISSPFIKNINSKLTIDSLFGMRSYTYKLLQSCDKNSNNGFYYYVLHIPNKITSWLKLTWTCSDMGCSVSLDCYDDWSRQYADLVCAN